MSKNTFIEVFGGAGGLSLGLEKSGFLNKAIVELNKDCVQTLRNNKKDWNIFHQDIKEFVKTQKVKKTITSVDLISGGLPCQSFSVAGKKKGLSDPRGALFWDFIDLIKIYLPKVVLMENVQGLLTHEKGETFSKMIAAFKNIGYKTYFEVLNSWNFGVAQKRKRLFVIGIKNTINKTFSFPKPFIKKLVLKDVLKNVPSSKGIYYSEKKKKVMKLVSPGKCHSSLPTAIAKDYMGKSFYSGGGRTGMARRLAWDEPSLTLTTSPNQKQTERCHPSETRPLSVNEYARIQSFPDDWLFSGSIYSQYKQIGNAVPVNLAKEVGKTLFSFLND